MSEVKNTKNWKSRADWPKGLRQRSENGIYYFSYREKGKKNQSIKSLGVTDLKAAISLSESMRKELDREGKLNMSKYEVKSLDDLIAYFMERQDIKEKTKWRHGNMFEQLKMFLKENYPAGLDDVSLIPEESVLNEYKNQRLAGGEKDGVMVKGASVSTTNQEMGLFKRLFDGCAGMLYGMPNPFLSPPYIKDNPNPKELQILTSEEIPKFLDQAKNYDKLKGAKTNHGDELYEIFYTYLNTGMRDTELRYLEWNDVDFEDERIWIRSQKNIEEKRAVVLASKSHFAAEYLRDKCEGYRSNEKVFKKIEEAEYFAKNYQFTFRKPEMLMELKVSDFSPDFETFEYKRMVTWNVKKQKERAIPMSAGVKGILEKRKKMARSNLVFPDDEGGLIRYRLRDRLLRVCKEIGIPRITELHSLRRTFATIARKRGMKIETLQAVLGHSSITTTIELYAKYTDEEGKVEMLKLDGAFELGENRKRVVASPGGVGDVDENIIDEAVAAKVVVAKTGSSEVVAAKPEMRLVFYAVGGNQVCSLACKCPKCGGDWAEKEKIPSCPTCGVWMRRDVKFLIKDRECPACGEKNINISNRSCEAEGCGVYFDEGMALIVE